jgi:hypothetical protein
VTAHYRRYRHMPLAASVAVLGLLSTAFAPASSTAQSDVDAGTASVDGIPVTFYTDSDDSTLQPVVLELVRTIDETGQTTGTGRWANQGYAYAYAVIGEDVCGDVQGALDQQMVRSIVDYVAGHRAGADDVFLPGVDGRVVAYAEDELGGMLLAAAASAQGAHLAGVATAGAVIDPHEVRFSDGNVARTSATTVALRSPLCPDGPDATIPNRNAFWDSRDLSLRPESLAGTPTLFLHDGAGPSPAAPLLDLWQGLNPTEQKRATHRELIIAPAPVSPRFGDQTVTPQPLDLFVESLFDGDSTGRYRYGNPVRINHGAASCDLGGCYTRGGAAWGTNLLDQVSTTTLFLNRTVEQDLSCVPVCVPGPGTGESGTLESVNRFEPPHAPVSTWLDGGADSETLTQDDPLNDDTGIVGDVALSVGHGYHSLAFQTAAVTRPTRILGRVELDGHFQTGAAGGTITPILVHESNGTTDIIARGAVDLDFHADTATRNHVNGWKAATIRFDLANTVLAKGDRLMVILQSNNIDHFEAGTAQGTVNIATGPVDAVTDRGAVLRIPVLSLYGSPFG